MAEHILVVSRVTGAPALGDELSIAQAHEPLFHTLGIVLLADEGCHRVQPEHLTEHAGGPQQLARFGIQ
jgi:hypothetical protein